MSFGGSDTSALSELTGSQQNNNLYDPDKAYTQKLMAYEMYGPQGVTGSEYNPFNTGPSTANPDPKQYTDAPPDWQHGRGYLPNSPITPNDTLPPPYGGNGNGNNVWNPGTGMWQHDPLPPPTGGGGDPGGGGGGPSANPFQTRTLTNRPLAQNLPVQHVGDPGTPENPIENPNRGHQPVGPPRQFPNQGPTSPPSNASPFPTYSV